MTWAKLDGFVCPAKGCPSKNKKTWVCKKDQSAMYINEKGIVECCGTPLHTGNLATWGWNCGDSYHNGEYIRGDFEGFTFALSMAVQMMGKMGSVWVTDLIQEIEKQLN